jgi:hypothetical protein
VLLGGFLGVAMILGSWLEKKHSKIIPIKFFDICRNTVNRTMATVDFGPVRNYIYSSFAA